MGRLWNYDLGGGSVSLGVAFESLKTPASFCLYFLFEVGDVSSQLPASATMSSAFFHVGPSIMDSPSRTISLNNFLLL